MRLARLCLLALVLAVPEAPAVAIEAAAPPPRALLAAAAGRAVPPERPPEDVDMRCTADRRSCIALATYIPDVCRTIAAAARAQALDPHFFARLLWKESLFDAAAVSPAGAEGIAQFMPGTAALRGLRDPFNPAEALHASAAYLAELAREFGNIGLAAVAYNAGEARAGRFLAKESGLPGETRAYVEAITGHSAEAWRDAPPASIDLALAKGSAFEPACIAQAGNRSLREFAGTPLAPWGVVVASNRVRDGAARQVARLKNRHGALLRGEQVAYSRARRPGMPGQLFYAQIGRQSRADADALCARLRAGGADCMVLAN